MLLLDRNDIKSVFTMKDAIEASKLAFLIFSSGKCEIPLRTNIEVSKHDGVSLFMPGYVEDLNALGIKIVSVFPKNPDKGKSSVPSTMILIDGTDGEVCCILDGTYLTQLRTGAAAGAAIDLLSNVQSKIGALIGIGGQALSQLEAMLTVRVLSEVRIYNRNLQRANSFIKKAKEELNLSDTVLRAVESPDEAIIDADIITVVTTSKEPVFDGNKVKQGAHINGIGSFMPDMQELDETIINRADKIYFDSKEAVLAESGDFIKPLEKGIIKKDNFKGDLGLVVSGKLEGRCKANEITLFKSVGIAILDIVTANSIYKKALEENTGKIYDFI